jgi:hypothetical protein
MQFSKPRSDRQHLLAAALKCRIRRTGVHLKTIRTFFLCRLFKLSRESLGKQSFSDAGHFFAKTMRHAFKNVTNDEVVRVLENRHNRMS